MKRLRTVGEFRTTGPDTDLNRLTDACDGDSGLAEATSSLVKEAVTNLLRYKNAEFEYFI